MHFQASVFTMWVPNITPNIFHVWHHYVLQDQLAVWFTHSTKCVTWCFLQLLPPIPEHQFYLHRCVPLISMSEHSANKRRKTFNLVKKMKILEELLSLQLWGYESYNLKHLVEVWNYKESLCAARIWKQRLHLKLPMYDKVEEVMKIWKKCRYENLHWMGSQQEYEYSLKDHREVEGTCLASYIL